VGRSILAAAALVARVAGKRSGGGGGPGGPPGLREGLLDLLDLGELGQGDDAAGARGQDGGEVLGDLVAGAEVAQLADRRAAGAQPEGAGEDGGREQDADHATGDRPGEEAVAGLVVGHLDDVDLALGVGARDEHALDVERAGDLGLQQAGVGALGGVLVGEAGDDDRVPLGVHADGALGEDPVLVGDDPGHERAAGVRVERGRRDDPRLLVHRDHRGGHARDFEGRVRAAGGGGRILGRLGLVFRHGVLHVFGWRDQGGAAARDLGRRVGRFEPQGYGGGSWVASSVEGVDAAPRSGVATIP
jgi:hypothetical protein